MATTSLSGKVERPESERAALAATMGSRRAVEAPEGV